MKDGNYLIGLLTNKSVVWLPGSSLKVGLRPAGLSLFTLCFGGLVHGVEQGSLLRKGKKKAK